VHECVSAAYACMCLINISARPFLIISWNSYKWVVHIRRAFWDKEPWNWGLKDSRWESNTILWVRIFKIFSGPKSQKKMYLSMNFIKIYPKFKTCSIIIFIKYFLIWTLLLLVLIILALCFIRLLVIFGFYIFITGLCFLIILGLNFLIFLFVILFFGIFFLRFGLVFRSLEILNIRVSI